MYSVHLNDYTRLTYTHFYLYGLDHKYPQNILTQMIFLYACWSHTLLSIQAGTWRDLDQNWRFQPHIVAWYIYHPTMHNGTSTDFHRHALIIVTMPKQKDTSTGPNLHALTYTEHHLQKVFNAQRNIQMTLFFTILHVHRQLTFNPRTPYTDIIQLCPETERERQTDTRQTSAVPCTT